MENPQETRATLIKLALYLLGVSIGLGAKLATINKERDLKMKEAIAHTLVAFATAFVVWFICYYKLKEPNYAVMCAVLCGRFGDAILVLSWKMFKKILSNANDFFQNPNI